MFTDIYCRTLYRSWTPRFETFGYCRVGQNINPNVPAHRRPQTDVGKAMKQFYDDTVGPGRIITDPVTKASLQPHLIALNSQLPKGDDGLGNPLIPEFTFRDYEIVRFLRQESLNRKNVIDELDENPRAAAFWGSSRQFLFGKVVQDLFNYDKYKKEHPLAKSGEVQTPLIGVFCSPTGGIIGPGAKDKLATAIGTKIVNYETLCYHAIVHDAAGYCRNSHGLGPGYMYRRDVPGAWNFSFTRLFSWFVDPGTLALSFQLNGCYFWSRIISEAPRS